MTDLTQVRRLEAVSFRSFPSTSTHYDGTWAIRLTAGNPAKRLNSVNPLDPSDHAYIDARLELAKRRFESFGRPLIFRQSPLAPPELEKIFDDRGWEIFDESIVMNLNLSSVIMDDVMDHVPMKDIGYWVDSFLHLSDNETSLKPGLFEVISSIEPNCGLFVKKVDDQNVAAVRCVHENDLVGIFDLVTGNAFKRRGFAKSLLASALKWAKMAGAKQAWLQVVAENNAARGLYEEFGFTELYRYNYRRAPSGNF